MEARRSSILILGLLAILSLFILSERVFAYPQVQPGMQPEIQIATFVGPQPLAEDPAQKAEPRSFLPSLGRYSGSGMQGDWNSRQRAFEERPCSGKVVITQDDSDEPFEIESQIEAPGIAGRGSILSTVRFSLLPRDSNAEGSSTHSLVMRKRDYLNVLEGRTSASLLEMARDLNSDLIVVGSARCDQQGCSMNIETGKPLGEAGSTSAPKLRMELSVQSDRTLRFQTHQFTSRGEMISHSTHSLFKEEAKK